MGIYKELLIKKEKEFEEGSFPQLSLKQGDILKWEKLYTKLEGLVQNAKETAKLVSASPVVRETGECVFFLMTPEGNPLCVSSGIFVHIGSTEKTIKFMLMNDYEERVGIKEGDYFFNNDAYIGNAHTADMLVVTPIFYEGELVGWAGGLTHTPETGGTEAGGQCPGAMTRYDEGIALPCVKIAENEEIKADLELIVERGTRTSTWWLLDNRAKMAGCRIIRESVKELIREFGKDYYMTSIYEYIEDTRRACTKRIQDVLFPGRYRTINLYDVAWENAPVRYPLNYEHITAFELVVTPEGELYLDFEGTSPPGMHCNNSSLPCTLGNLISQAIQYLFYGLKLDGGINQVLISPKHCHVPPSFINPVHLHYSTTIWAAAVCADNVFVDCLSRAYYPKGFREEVSGTHALTCFLVTGGKDAEGREFGFTVFEATASGLGAAGVMDGVDTGYAAWNPEGDFGDSEIWEQIIPQMWLGRRPHPDGGGFGKYRGGNGIESLYFVENTDLVEIGSCVSATRVYSTPGLMGAYPAAANYRDYIVDTNLKELIAAKKPIPHSEGDDPDNPDWKKLLKATFIKAEGQTVARPFKRHDLWHQLTNSGGGYGDPIERDPKLIERDLSNGLTHPFTVERVYCAEMDPETLKIDYEKTEIKRENKRKERLKKGIPVKEYIKKKREDVLSGAIPSMSKKSINECLERSEKFRKEFREFWSLPEDFTQIS